MRRFTLAVVVCAFAVSGSAFAVTRNWTGLGGNNNWSTPGNWSPAGAPVAGDSLVGPFGGTPLTMVNDLPPTILGYVQLSDAYVLSGNPVHVSQSIYSNASITAPIVAEDDISASASYLAQVDANGHTVQVAGTIGQLVGTGTIHFGAGPVTLTGAHAFSGTVGDGASWFSSNPITLNGASIASATFNIVRALLGYGQIGALHANGSVDPSTGGNAIGIIETGNLTFTRNGANPEEFGEYHVDIAASGNDVLDVTGSVELNGKPLDVSLVGGYSPATGTSWVIVNNDSSDPIDGIFVVRDHPFDGLPTELPEGQKFEAAGRVFRISYVGGNGNDVELTTDVGPITQATSTTVEVSATTATAGETISISAVVTGVHPLEGTVTFLDDATELATVTIQSAYINRTFSPGSHSITARYNGTATYEASTSDPKVIFMKIPTAISATATLSGGVLTINGHVTSTIGSAIPDGTMSVREGANFYGTASLDGSGNATLQIAPPPGVEELSVDYLGNSAFGSSWTTVNISVLQTPMISIHDSVQNEDAGAIEVTVTLGGTAGHTVTVDYATSNSSAVAGEDYDAATGTIVFTAGQTLKSVDIDLNPDSDPEDDETFAITLSNPTGGNIADSDALLTILNDDDAFLLYSDLQYGAAGIAATATPLLLDLRVPMEGGPFPLVVVIDALRWSQPDHHSELANFLPSRGYAVATIGFRAAPGGQFPAQIDDLKTAIVWLRTNAAQYQLDLKRMAVLGSGRAGGHIAAFAAVTERIALGIDAAIIGRGATNLTAIVASSCDGVADIAAFLGCTACPDITANASPLTYVSADDAPFLIFRSDADCGQSSALTNGLRAVNVDATMQEAPPADGAIDWSLPEVRQSVVQFLDAKVKQQETGRTRAVRK